MVAVYEYGGAWSGFFGFGAETEYEILPPRGLSHDVDENGNVNTRDLLLVLVAITSTDPTKINPRVDVNRDGVVNIADLLLVIDYLDDPVTGAAPALKADADIWNPRVLRAGLNLLHEQNDGSVKYQRSIRFMENMLAVSTPEGRLVTTWARLKGGSTIE